MDDRADDGIKVANNNTGSDVSGHVSLCSALISVSCCPPDSCILPQDRGSCDNYTMMWFFDAAQKECARFWYGGCGGNKNRFLTQEECQSLCGTKIR
uniref:BPTI/Kunitz inhibitor domain-containing protein n=1 Tax=Haplochromis burtoni TaxID=8153 RepID=A0A3Q2WKE1_HAPBU